MSSQWCTIAQVFDQIPEFQSDHEVGIISTGTVERAIEQVTHEVRAKIAGRYDLTVIETGLAASNLDALQYIVAQKTAAMIVIRHNLGTQGDARLDDLRNSVMLGFSRVATGSLLYNDGTKVPITNAPDAYSPPVAESLGDLFDDGDRYAQPTI